MAVTLVRQRAEAARELTRPIACANDNRDVRGHGQRRRVYQPEPAPARLRRYGVWPVIEFQRPGLTTAEVPRWSCGTATSTWPTHEALPSVASKLTRYTRPSPWPLRSALTHAVAPFNSMPPSCVVLPSPLVWVGSSCRTPVKRTVTVSPSASVMPLNDR